MVSISTRCVLSLWESPDAHYGSNDICKSALFERGATNGVQESSSGLARRISDSSIENTTEGTFDEISTWLLPNGLFSSASSSSLSGPVEI